MARKRSLSPLQSMRKHAGDAEALLKEMANTHRILALYGLSEEEKTVSELLEQLDLSQSALSQHLARLRAAKLVSAEKRGKEVYYRLASPEAQALLSTLYLMFRRKK